MPEKRKRKRKWIVERRVRDAGFVVGGSDVVVDDFVCGADGFASVVVVVLERNRAEDLKWRVSGSAIKR